MASGYITQLDILGFGGGSGVWTNKVNTVEPGGVGSMNASCFTIDTDTSWVFGNTVIDSAEFQGQRIRCHRKQNIYEEIEYEGCFVRLSVTPEFSGLKPDSLTITYTEGVFEYDSPWVLRITVYDENGEQIGYFEEQRLTAGAAWNIQTTILLDYETYLSEGLASIALVNESAIPF